MQVAAVDAQGSDGMAEQTPEGKRIKDCRGRSVMQLDPVMLHVLHREVPIEAAALHEIVEELEPGTAKHRRRLIVIIPVLVVLVVAGVGALYHFSDAGARRDLVSTLKNPAIMLPSLVGGVFVPWITARQVRMKRVRFVMLKHRRCPHCGYNLHGLPTAPEDQATVCPECGCAWQIDDAALDERLAAAGASARPSTAVPRALVVGLLVLAAAGVLALLVFMYRS
ncbi:MAG: hypothetical protein GY778_05510 [bacterium]|nr:hypothetical protein [bacterium]